MNKIKTFYEVSRIWSEAKRPIVKHSTMCAYLLTLHAHLLPRFGAMETITENDVQLCDRQMYFGIGKKDSKRYGSGT